jgi:phosphate transport system protein
MEKSDFGHHILSRYNEDLEKLRSDVLRMGGLAEAQLQRSLAALSSSDEQLAREVLRDEVRLNQMEVEVDEECMRILATRSPAASDLRLVVAIVKTITDLERIGDEARKIANISTRHTGLDRGGGEGYRVVRHLGRVAQELLHSALDVFARLDANAALEAVKRDRLLDEEYDAVQRQCITFMIEDPRTIRPAIDLLWVARALERIGDHAKNVCEYVIYMVGGRDVRHTALAEVEQHLRATTAATPAAESARLEGPATGP